MFAKVLDGFFGGIRLRFYRKPIPSTNNFNAEKHRHLPVWLQALYDMALASLTDLDIPFGNIYNFKYYFER